MAIFRCNKCGHLAELEKGAAGTALNCPRCAHPGTAYETTYFVGKLLDQYFASQASLKRMQAEADAQEAPEVRADSRSLEGLNLFNTDQIATDLQHGPIHEWFKTRKIQFKPNYKAVDTTGFFDEVGVQIGRDYELLKAVVEQIRYAQTKGHSSINLNLARKSQKDAQTISDFCRRLYDYSFVARYFFQKTEKTIRLILQTSAPVRYFFAGEWLEWFALMELLELCKEQKVAFSCARNVSVEFSNEDLHELDVFGLLNGTTPICVECKTGEYRQHIDRYGVLRKRLGLSKEQFIVCVSGLSDEHASGLSSMYDLSFVSERGLRPHLARLT